MEEAFGSRVEAVDPISVLSQQHFFTSTVLAQLSTQAEVLSRDALPDWKLQQLGILDEFTCPVCLGVLHDPVILSCAHRFCWGCVVAHCANQMITRQKAQATQGGEVQKEVNVGKASDRPRAPPGTPSGFQLKRVRVPTSAAPYPTDPAPAAAFPAEPRVQGYHAGARVAQLAPAPVRHAPGGVASPGPCAWRPGQHVRLPGLPEAADRGRRGPAGGRGAEVSGAARGGARARGARQTAPCPSPHVLPCDGPLPPPAHSRFVERLQNLRLTQTGQSVPGAGAADRSRDMLESMVSSHAALVDTLRDLVVPHPSHWLSEVQSTAQGEADPGESGEKPAGAAITMGIRPAPAEERGANGAADVQRPRRGTLGAPATVSDALRVQGLHGPEGGDKEKYGAQVDRLGAEQALLPEQRPEHRGKLTVVLDLDGTLVSTYTVKRAPAVPRGYLRAYVVGKGGPLNTDGVFVVERPGLREFLTSLSQARHARRLQCLGASRHVARSPPSPPPPRSAGGRGGALHGRPGGLRQAHRGCPGPGRHPLHGVPVPPGHGRVEVLPVRQGPQPAGAEPGAHSAGGRHPFGVPQPAPQRHPGLLLQGRCGRPPPGRGHPAPDLEPLPAAGRPPRPAPALPDGPVVPLQRIRPQQPRHQPRAPRAARPRCETVVGPCPILSCLAQISSQPRTGRSGCPTCPSLQPQ